MENIENNETVSLAKPAFQYGLLTGIAMVVISILYYLAGDSQHWSSSIISYLVLLGGIIYGLKTFRDEFLGGVIKYGKALGFGVLLSMFAGVFLGLYTFVFYKFLAPDTLQVLLIEAEQQVIEVNPEIADAELDFAMSLTKRLFINPYSFLFFTVLSTTFTGTIFSLITAIFIKKEE